jgi:hypothetical protein
MKGLLTQFRLHTHSAPGGAAARVWMDCAPSFDNSILAFGEFGAAVFCMGGGSATLTCCDLFGNAGGDWVGCLSGQLEVSGNLSADPLFCAPGEGNLHLRKDSPCAEFSPPNPECSLIGAYPVECDETPVLRSNWGRLKRLYGR